MCGIYMKTYLMCVTVAIHVIRMEPLNNGQMHGNRPVIHCGEVVLGLSLDVYTFVYTVKWNEKRLLTIIVEDVFFGVSLSEAPL